MATKQQNVEYWNPEPFWKGQDVFIYGGGPSLKSFDHSILADEKVIGCNDAYMLGHAICDICVFGDLKWFKKHRRDLQEYKITGGTVVTNERRVTMLPDTAWIKKMKRRPDGLSRKALAWNRNTGSPAINLALILGASRVFLLGFDMHLGKAGEANWHANPLDKPRDNVYNGMLQDFESAKKALPKLFPDAVVYNVNDDTRLKCFPILASDVFWEARKQQGVTV